MGDGPEDQGTSMEGVQRPKRRADSDPRTDAAACPSIDVRDPAFTFLHERVDAQTDSVRVIKDLQACVKKMVVTLMRLDSVPEKLESMQESMISRIQSLEARVEKCEVDLAQRVVALEAKLILSVSWRRNRISCLLVYLIRRLNGVLPCATQLLASWIGFRTS
ncbi:hypothetical protein BSKO_09309 [Bryopsis sp. KO-2023]|nr:hypothetical protein BSKO_09309 [Bryopsis sp. KO-2023]